MGRGIAQLCAQAGLDTLLFDSRAGAVKEAIAAIDRGLEGLVAKGRMTADTRRAVLSRIKPISSFDEAKPAGIAIEAIVEDIAAKRTLFAELEARVAADAIIATNTSSLSVTEVAAGCARPARVAGLHFFNPPPLMKLVEVIGGLRTDRSVVEATGAAAAIAVAQRAGSANTLLSQPTALVLWSITPAAPMAPRRCALWRMASRARRKSTL